LTKWLLEHPAIMVFLCGLALILLSELVDRIFELPFQIKLPKRLLAAISIVLVTTTYFTVFALTAIGFRARGRRLLPDFRKNNPKTYWTEREKTEPTLDYLKRQF